MTLFDVLIILAIVGLLVGLARPALAHLILDARMTAAVNAFVHAAFVAKQTARTTWRETTLCKSLDGFSCANQSDWHGGWIVFANLDEDHPPQVDAGERVIEVHPAYAGGVITANRRAFAFRPHAWRSTNGTLILCDRRGPAFAKAVIISYTARPRVQAAVDAGKPFQCPV